MERTGRKRRGVSAVSAGPPFIKTLGRSMPQQMGKFTLFHLTALMFVGGGLAYGAGVGSKNFGTIGLVLGAVVGACAGLICGQAMFMAVYYWRSRRIANIRRRSTGGLKALLRRDDDLFDFGFALAELQKRGEDIRPELGRVVTLLRSDVRDRRFEGWEILKLLYPDVSKQVSSYSPFDSADVCRSKTYGIV